MQRCIDNDTFSNLLGNKSNMSKGLLEQYPDAPIMFKDTVFLDFLGLPKKKQLQAYPSFTNKCYIPTILFPNHLFSPEFTVLLQ